MEETYVRLVCPECDKHWEASPGDLPEPARTFHCPSCTASRPLSEFARTDHDLKAMKRF